MWPSYQLDREFQLPGMDQSFAVFDVLSDGRIISSDGRRVSVEDAVGSGSFTTLRDLHSGYSPFIRANSNDTIACGDGGEILFFDSAQPDNSQSVGLAGYDAEWKDDRHVVVSVPGKVVVIDVTSVMTADLVIGIGGASAGVTFDGDGNFYTGNGLDSDTTSAAPSVTGTVKYFSAAVVENVLSTSSPLNFERTGIPVCELLSAAYLGFDSNGDLHVAGADPQGSDFGFAALVLGDAIALASGGGVVIDEQAPQSVLHSFDPDSAANNFYFVNSNNVTGELYFSDLQKQLVYSYK